MVLVLTDAEIDEVLALESLASEVEHALVEQAAGAVERPERPHYPVGAGLDSDEPLGTGLAMPAYVHGEDYFATKLASIHEGNTERGLPTLHAQIVLADARTGCIGGLAARELATDPVRVGVVGAGAQARWQTRAIAALCDVESVAIHSPSDSRRECAGDLNEEGIPASAVGSAADAVRDADVVVTATTSADPVFPADALGPGTLVVAIGAYESGMQELEPGVFDRAARVFADVPEEVATIGDLAATSLTAADLVPMAALFDGTGRASAEEIVVVESVGSAVFDVAAATAIYEAAQEAGLGTDLAL